mmetsp:Transcript_53088/g.153111  ORF Transcript_53088/g.153111 Transcript_53088/m.153111 type:complete len:223 (-) Transcript_53088:202-870(-)
MADDEEEVVLPENYTLTTDAGEKKSSIGFTGKGTAKYTNGDEYEGNFEKGVRQGPGIYRYIGGDVFEGTFENNIKSGLGRVTYKKGGFFHGHFKDGQREGEGTFQYPNGDIYSGMWEANRRHGMGTYVFNKTKYFYRGEWREGKMVRGEWRLTDGTTFHGDFQNQKPCGEGAWHMKGGTIVKGSYAQEILPVDKAPPAKEGEEVATMTKTNWRTTSMEAAEE